MNPAKVIADVVYAWAAGNRYTPTVLTLNRTALNRDDVVTSQIETLLYAFGGAFSVKPVPGLKATELVKSSPNSMLVDNVVASVSGEAATKGFKPDEVSRPLALRLGGKFTTAFPEGRPKSEAPARRTPSRNPSLRRNLHSRKRQRTIPYCSSPTRMLNDGAAVDIQEVFGRRMSCRRTATSRSRRASSSSSLRATT